MDVTTCEFHATIETTFDLVKTKLLRMKNNKKLLFWALICSLMLGLSGFTTLAHAGGVNDSKDLLSVSNTNQKKKIQGTVKDAKGEGLVGASIVEKGTTNGTIADVDGNFSFEASVGAVVKVSSIGYHDKEFVVDAKTDYAIVLDDNSKLIDEVVVVGYGTMKKQNLTGSVSAVNFDEAMASRPTMNLSSALTGLSAGLNISQMSGQPGKDSEVKIRVRGQGSIEGYKPLIIIDGVEGELNDINPNDVESVSVLKDAASSSIYGSRAANGVILVTTKKGAAGRISVNYSGYVGWQTTAKKIDFINDFATHLELVNEANGLQTYDQALIDNWRKESAAGNPLYPNTDWYDEMLKTSVLTEHNLTVRGGGDRTNFAMSLGYLDNKGIVDNSGFKKYSFRVNVDTKATKWLDMGANVYGFWSDIKPIEERDFFNQLKSTSPGVIPVDSQGRYGSTMFPKFTRVDNPRAYIDNLRGNNERQKLGLKVYGKVKFLQHFEWENSFGFNYENARDWVYTRPYSLWNLQSEDILYTTKAYSDLKNTSLRRYQTILNSLLRFNYSLDKTHNFSALLGFDQQYKNMDVFSAEKQQILGDDVIYILDAGADMKSISGKGSDDALRSYFGRINYDYKGKYLLEANFRYDGSSRFPKDNRWGAFPSFSAGWRLSEETFAQPLKSVFNDIKLRGSWGRLGNNSVGDYSYQMLYIAQMYSFGNKLYQGASPNTELMSNGDIKWETTTLTNVGLDLTLLNNRLSFSVEYYNKNTSDLLAQVPVPLVMGKFSKNPWQNIAEMRNRGVEIQATYHGNIGKDFSYSISGNLSTVSNKVTKYSSESIIGPSIIRQGESFGSFYLFKFDRIIQSQQEIDDLKAQGYTFHGDVGDEPKPGDFLYKDTNGDKVFDKKDMVATKSSLPKVTYGINLNMAYKDFDMSVVGQGVGGVYGYWGNDGFNTFNINEGFLMRTNILDRWTPENKSTKYPRLQNSGAKTNTMYSDYWLHNTSYFRIKSIQLGYSLPKNLATKLMVERLRVYTNLENYFTFTSFEGYNPENPDMAYPLMKQWVVGLNITF